MNFFKQIVHSLISVSLLLLFACHAPVTRQYQRSFEGEFISQIMNSSGHSWIIRMYTKNNRTVQRTEIPDSIFWADYYVKPDTIIVVSPRYNKGYVMSRDFYLNNFQVGGTDTFLRSVETSKEKMISGFLCKCTECYYTSGAKKEYWLTSLVDSDICSEFVQWNYNDIMSIDGSADFIRKMNRDNKVFIEVTKYDKKGSFVFDILIKKFAKRPIEDKEMALPSDITLVSATSKMWPPHKVDSLSGERMQGR